MPLQIKAAITLLERCLPCDLTLRCHFIVIYNGVNPIYAIVSKVGG